MAWSPSTPLWGGFTIGVERNPRFEHRRIVGRLALGESKIDFAKAVKGCERIWTAAAPGACERDRECIEPAPRHVNQEFVTVAEVPVWRRWTYSCPSGSFREGETGGPLLRNQLQCRADQSLS